MTEGQDETGEHDRPPADAALPELRAQRPRVLLLGGDETGRELAVALQRLGAEVIAADSHAGAPAQQVADQTLVVAMDDAAELSAAIGRLRPQFVVTLDDAVAPDALQAAEAEGAVLVPSARSVRMTVDREGLRRLAADELGLPTAPFWFVESAAELEAVAAHAGFPLLVKPVAGPDGGNRTVVRTADEVARAWELATEGGGDRVWAETVVTVQVLVTLIVVRTEGPTGPVIEFCSALGHRRADTGELESWQPQQLTTAAMDAAKSVAARIVKALGGRGVFSVELMINGDEVYFAEVLARPLASAWVTLRSQRLSAFELHARTILGVAVDTMMVSPGAARVVRGADSGGAGLTAIAGALNVPESDVRMFGLSAPESGAAQHLTVALATAPDVAAARDRAREVATRLNVPDSRE